MWEVTQDQIDIFVSEFDERIYPIMTSAFSVPPTKDGSNTTLQEIYSEIYGFECCNDFSGDGDKTIVLVDNIRDMNFYNVSHPNGRTYMGGFVSTFLLEFMDRHVFTIDSFNWLTRAGSSPEDKTGDDAWTACAEHIRRPPDYFRAIPYSYESTFAHEFTHLLSSYIGRKDNFLEEGIADYSTYIVGYEDLSLEPTDKLYSSHIKAFLGFLDGFGGPEQSLTGWGEQGFPEILADYGAVFSFVTFMANKFGEDFIETLHRSGETRNAVSLNALMASQGFDITFSDLVQTWLVSVAVSSLLSDGATLVSADYSLSDLEFPYIPRSRVNWTTPEAYSHPGAPNNGADYVRLRGGADCYLGAADIQEITFTGASLYPKLDIEWTVVNETLYSGSGDNFDRWIVREFDISGGGMIALDLEYSIEIAYDFFYVQIYDDDSQQWVYLESEYTTYESEYGFNTPGITGTSNGIETNTFDASAYASQGMALIALRYVTDGFVSAPGVYVHGMRIDGTDVTDFADLSLYEERDYAVYDWSLTLLSYKEDDMSVPLYVTKVALDENFHVVLDESDLANMIGTSGDVVAAVVSVVEPTGQVSFKATYTLTVTPKTFTQPGGGGL